MGERWEFKKGAESSDCVFRGLSSRINVQGEEVLRTRMEERTEWIIGHSVKEVKTLLWV